MGISVSGRTSQEVVFTGANELAQTRKQKYNSQLRTMQQITSLNGGKPIEYVFLYAPQSFTHEGYGVNLNQIPRPYMAPIVDVTSGNARKASFEFNIMAQLDLYSSQDLGGKNLAEGQKRYLETIGDGFTASADAEISIIQAFADNAVPVTFNNVHKQLLECAWYIESATFTHNRAALKGGTTIATCSISLVEFTSTNKKLILLPRFKYGNITQTSKKKTTTEGTQFDDAVGALKGVGWADDRISKALGKTVTTH